jgi:hypothetical protein
MTVSRQKMKAVSTYIVPAQRPTWSWLVLVDPAPRRGPVMKAEIAAVWTMLSRLDTIIATIKASRVSLLDGR